MRLINVCHLPALSAVLASLIFSRDPEVKGEQLSLSSEDILWPPPLAKRVDINNLVSKELGQGWTLHVVKYYALVPVESAAQALESYKLQSGLFLS